jgi:PAS domain S-box-containing protein
MYFIRPNSKIFESLFTKSVDPIAITTRHGGVVQLNPAWHDVLGWKLEELSSESLLHFVHFNDIPVMLKSREQLELPGVLSSYGQLRFLHKEGEWRILEFNSTSFDGYHFTIYRDIMHRIQSERRTDANQRECGRLPRPTNCPSSDWCGWRDSNPRPSVP